MKQALALLSLVLLTSTVSAFADNDAAVVGKWRSDTPIGQSGSVVVYMGLDVKADSTTSISTICHYPDNKEVSATVTVKTDIAAGEMSWLESQHANAVDGAYTCNINVEVTKVMYKVDAKVLTLTNVTGAELTFSKQ